MQHAVNYDDFNSGLNSRPLRPSLASGGAESGGNCAANADNEICMGGHLQTWLLNFTYILCFYVDIKEYFMQMQIQSSKISDSYTDDYEYCFFFFKDEAGTLHLPTELHGSNRCTVNGNANHNERLESINICEVTGTHGVIFQKTGISTVISLEAQFSRNISNL
jgi:hypothetical protein